MNKLSAKDKRLMEQINRRFSELGITGRYIRSHVCEFLEFMGGKCLVYRTKPRRKVSVIHAKLDPHHK